MPVIGQIASSNFQTGSGNLSQIQSAMMQN